ncbi:hypothetical protein [Geomonas propionica]|uniref:Uncharacterized protein n=1 Tax=Geomonas propionica TaxID=2798582 RepID=A0ABS0YL21_9BACT|nr:hypothetical protein [Geomonas propionica]MBJ6798642.1 hypothetical protein [Geomonas propionica]
MAAFLDLKKINKTIKIFAVAQFGLIAILIYTAINFQQRLQAVGRGYRFMNGVIYAFVIQLLFFYPIFKFAGKEADRDFTLVGKIPTPEEGKAFAKKKRWADIIKISVMSFYFIFAVAAPADPFILSVIIYSFLLTVLTYLQCYSAAMKKLSRTA